MDDTKDNIYGAIITAQPLLEFTRSFDEYT